MKRFFSLLLCFIIVLSLSLPAYAAGFDKVILSMDKPTVSSGDVVTITVKIRSETNFNSLEIKPVFDSSVFKLVGGSCDVKDASIAEFRADSGFRIEYGTGGIMDGTIGTFQLKIIEGASAGIYQIGATAEMDGEKLEVDVVQISVLCVHSYGEWTKKDDLIHTKVCGLCGDAQSENHALINTTITKTPTCLEEGSQSGDCSVCGSPVNQILTKTDDHDYGVWSDNSDGSHHRNCNVCGSAETSPHQWVEGEVLKAATCKETGTMKYGCVDCGAEKLEEIPVSEEHVFEGWIRIDEEYHEGTCVNCGIAKQTEAHRWDDGTVIFEATCKDEGMVSRSCTECIATTTQAIEKLDTHRYSDDCDEVCNICDETRDGKHTYSKYWSMDQKEHWHQCTNCGKKTDIGTHLPGAAATETTPQICWLCEYVIKPALGHEHDYAEELTIDETGHWHACSGCEEKMDYEKHILYNNCDTDCAVCSYTRQTEHQFSLSLSSDATGHWYACTECGEQSEFESHTSGPEANEFEAQICTICGFEIVPAFGHTHIYGEEWIDDPIHHWRQCACGEKAEKDYHIWVNGVENDDGTVTFTCSDCQTQTITGTPRSNAIWWILLLLLIAGGGITAYWAIRKRKAQ